MCLNTVSHTVENASKTIAYKIMYSAKKDKVYKAIFKDCLYEKGKWYKAREIPLEGHKDGTVYTSGFHCFASLEDVLDLGLDRYYTIVKVELRGRLTIGKQTMSCERDYEQVPVIVASEMKIIAEEVV